MAEERATQPHKLILNERKNLTMTGVTEVLSFEEDGVVMKTPLGTLTVQGQGLKLRTLSPEGGQVEVSGTVTALFYQEPRQSGGWARRLLK